MLAKISLLLACVAAQFDHYSFRLQHWNTGRLYAAEAIGNIIDFGLRYGPVCSGVKQEQIANNTLFGHLVCNEIGFSHATFIGRLPDYTKYMESQQIYHIPDSHQICQPEYVISGAKCTPCMTGQPCTLRENCKIKNFRVDGGTCLKSPRSHSSDIYIHCDAPSQPERGYWTEWTEEETFYEKSTDYFRQNTRNCRRNTKLQNLVSLDRGVRPRPISTTESTTEGFLTTTIEPTVTPPGKIVPVDTNNLPKINLPSPPICEGKWIELIPAGQCLQELEEDIDYNEHYDTVPPTYQSYYSNSDYNRDLSLTAIEPTTYPDPAEPTHVCECQLETSGEPVEEL